MNQVIHYQPYAFLMAFNLLLVSFKANCTEQLTLTQLESIGGLYHWIQRERI